MTIGASHRNIPTAGQYLRAHALPYSSVLMSWSFPGAAQLTIIPQPSIAVVGADVLLSLHGLQEGSYASVTWFQGIGFVRSILSYDTETETTITGPAFTDREVLQSNGSLIIRGVKVTDSGNYTIIVNSKDNKLMWATQGFQVYEWVTKPHVLANTTSIVEDEGAVSFTCVTPDTEIEVQWLLDNQSLPANDRLVLSQGNRTLTITQVHREDAGQYQCTTRNLISSISSDPVLKLDARFRSHNSSLSSGAIVGIVIGVLVAVALLAGLVYFLVIRRRYPLEWEEGLVAWGICSAASLVLYPRQRGSVGCRLHVASGDLHPSLCSALTTCMTLGKSFQLPVPHLLYL
uniref:Ig-like domain-containing protein n=1 Tax=Vombatus ursinus TaxID=29139 RepID=A0A4X2LQH3_VOMUR